MLQSLTIAPSAESRVELLAWLNHSMPTTAPNGNTVPPISKVEQCCSGVPYVMLLPNMLPQTYAPLVSSTRVKVPANHEFEAVANFKLMQDALHRNGVVKPDVLVNDLPKVIKGHFQANLQLLQWFKGLHDALLESGIVAGQGRAMTMSMMSGTSLSESAMCSTGGGIESSDSTRSESPAPRIANDEVNANGGNTAKAMKAKHRASAHLIRDAESRGDAAAAAAMTLLEGRRKSNASSHNVGEKGTPGAFERAAVAATKTQGYTAAAAVVEGDEEALAHTHNSPFRPKSGSKSKRNTSMPSSLNGSFKRGSTLSRSSTSGKPGTPRLATAGGAARDKRTGTPLSRLRSSGSTSRTGSFIGQPRAPRTRSAVTSSRAGIAAPPSLHLGDNGRGKRTGASRGSVVTGMSGSGIRAGEPTTPLRGRRPASPRPTQSSGGHTTAGRRASPARRSANSPAFLSTPSSTVIAFGGTGVVAPALNLSATPAVTVTLSSSSTKDGVSEDLHTVSQERLFYYDKLRMIENLVLSVAKKELTGNDVAAVMLARSIRDVLYANH